jgi:hypothetical protein
VDRGRHGERLRVDGTGRRLAPSGMADGTPARFKGGSGVRPVSSGVGAGAAAEVVSRDLVRGVQPTGQIWVIRELEALMRANGDLEVEGEGLVWGGGNHVGRGTEARAVFPTRRRTIAVRDEPVAHATPVCIHGGYEHPSRGRLSHDLAYTTHDGAPTGSWHRTPRRDSIIVGQQGCSITGPAPFMARRFTYRVDTHTALALRQ